MTPASSVYNLQKKVGQRADHSDYLWSLKRAQQEPTPGLHPLPPVYLRVKLTVKLQWWPVSVNQFASSALEI
ncbi:unnamed protein product [Pleuronectes platessa]|uniref:Uncharacterized protein n=1 Tax=Pleuronectes platessa TaxID=8262 RepID=A0A9N7V223_PLEPL|nr:unnamed protein product [Pleuronectes platessa]